jgi:23S rRNA pseudouridine2605 synthase
VYDLLGSIEDWVFPVGRLDRDTTDLLIMTNDTAFGAIIGPASKAPKTYLVKASLLLSDDQLGQLQKGIGVFS